MKIIILRGIPSSGKSTLAKELSEKYDALICSADDFCYWWGKGIYYWTSGNVSFSHQECQNKFAACIKAGKNVIVDNTNVKHKDMKYYLDLASFRAKELGDTEIYVLEPDTDWRYDVDECFRRNAHNVPKETIQRMLDSLLESKKQDNVLAEKYGVKFVL